MTAFKATAVGVVLAVALAGALAIALAMSNPPAPKPWTLEYYRTRATAGAQCHYANNSKAILFRTRDPRKMGLSVTSWSDDEPVVPLDLDEAGEVHYEANGGVTTYHSIDLAIERLRTLPTQPIRRATFNAFLEKKHVPYCGRKSFYVDLYTDEPLE